MQGGMARPPEPQAIVQAPTEAAIFLVLCVSQGAEEDVRDVLSDVGGVIRSVGFRIPDGRLSCVVGIGSALWDRMVRGPRPTDLHPFIELDGLRHKAPATPGDVLLHIRATRADLCFELAQRMVEAFGASAKVVDEVHGFRSFDERDLLGFVDGTENPVGLAAPEAALIGEEDPVFAGGSYVIVQRYLHDLSTWDALSVAEQELIVGRTKLSDIELSDKAKPSNSHVALNTILDADGNQRQVLRYNMPFGRVGDAEFGTYFIGYARDPGVLEQMLRNMFIGNPPGNTDRILDFSTAITGNLFFVPSLSALEELPSPTATSSLTDEQCEQAPARPQRDDHSLGRDDHSLGIGSLR
jgi:putative iron-dependent peroxidase